MGTPHVVVGKATRESRCVDQPVPYATPSLKELVAVVSVAMPNMNPSVKAVAGASAKGTSFRVGCCEGRGP